MFMVFPVTLFISMEFTNVRKVYKGKREPLGSWRRTSFFENLVISWPIGNKEFKCPNVSGTVFVRLTARGV